MKKSPIPGWTARIDETSNGVFQVTLENTRGCKVEITDHTPLAEMIERAKNDAFDIEKQISNNWSLFLYTLCVEKIIDSHITKKEYNDTAFGSWLIEKDNNRLVYDGKESWIILQKKIKR